MALNEQGASPSAIPALMTLDALTPIADTEPRYTYRWVILPVLWVTYIVVFLNRLSVGPLGPFIKVELGITSAQVGMVLSAASLGYLLTQVPIGWLADRIGARWPMTIGEFIAGGAMLALYFAPSYGALLGLMFVVGAGCGFLAPSTTQAVIVWFPQKERATVMGFKQTAINVGGMIGAAVLPIVALTWGWRAGFLTLGVVAFAAGVLSFLCYREPPIAAGRPAASSAAGATQLVDIVTNREIWLVAGAAFCLNWIELAMIGHFVLYLTNGLALSVLAAGGLLAFAEGAGAVARPISGWVSDRAFGGRRKPVFMAFAVIAAVGCLLLGLFGQQLGSMLYPVIFVLGLGGVGFGGVYLTLLSELGGRGGAAKAAGFGSTIAVGGSILGPPAFGHVVDRTGSYEVAWLSSAAIGVVSILLIALVRESRRKI